MELFGSTRTSAPLRGAALCLGGLLWFALAPAAHAQAINCYGDWSGNGSARLVNYPITINESANTPIGTVLARVTLSNNIGQTYSCKRTAYDIRTNVLGVFANSVNSPAPVPGHSYTWYWPKYSYSSPERTHVGYRLRYNGTLVKCCGQSPDDNSYHRIATYSSEFSGRGSLPGTLELEIIKVANTPDGASLSSYHYVGGIDFYQPGAHKNYLTYYSITLTYKPPPVAPTCAVSNWTRDVPLGQHPASDLTDADGITPYQNFNIVLNCSGGSGGGQRRVYVTLTDNNQPANRSNVLSLTGDSTAQGVGIRIERSSGGNFTPVSFGADSASIGNAGQWQHGTTTGGTVTIPLRAAMIRTGTGTVTPGLVRGRATFTMAYN
ncbi:fimbrial protein [Vulcaniibacterium tengchongense]|uniref:Type 1 fimbria pilin n=1 Tax=Vulcaniibacterium tengchongense TaxID=1273429 RepID=A0A3N4VFW6_9GAMM|nr:fimbrial protein [Vulcaniibacterium tengchongense]RPE81578.1 type 1 fimbria pilin [Vulcaniibacterium tengchongense]